MTRTPEQVAADEALTAAIEQTARAYGDDGQAWVTSEYVVAVAQHRFDDDGDPVTTVGLLYRDGDVPTHRALGLVEFAAVRLRTLAMDAVRMGDDED